MTAVLANVGMAGFMLYFCAGALACFQAIELSEELPSINKEDCYWWIAVTPLLNASSLLFVLISFRLQGSSLENVILYFGALLSVLSLVSFMYDTAIFQKLLRIQASLIS